MHDNNYCHWRATWGLMALADHLHSFPHVGFFFSSPLVPSLNHIKKKEAEG